MIPKPQIMGYFIQRKYFFHNHVFITKIGYKVIDKLGNLISIM